MTRKVCLDTIQSVKDFVEIVSRYPFGAVLKSGRYIVDAKSIMGIFSLNLCNVLTLEVEDISDEDSVYDFFHRIEKFIVAE